MKEKSLGRTPESWLAMKDAYNLWHAKKRVDLNGVERLKVDT
ncbi:MAG: HigA protein (antitoxin to HigB) [Gammaproteobacteria bacterium]|nr:HigA protein (antitoxin to HigB) [Gammaproteobacteria bacterium]MCF6229777.1 HigA protein (antitoxin to HigB) [Gammaproteobacteria bacterium]